MFITVIVKKDISVQTEFFTKNRNKLKNKLIKLINIK